MGRSLVVEADGGSRGNPGVAGYGALVRDAATGDLLAERAEPCGRASNNVAEYSGLIAGLQAVVDLGLGSDASIEVRMDSKLVIEQMAGRWKIKHEDMKRLALQAQDLCRQLRAGGATITWTWVPRAQNAAADRLSNDGMDGRSIRRDHVEPSGARDDAGEPGAPGATLFGDEAFDAGAAVDDLPAEPGEAGVRPGQALSSETTPTLDGACRLVLVRHGVTAYTETGRVDGRGGSDPALSPTGLAQARAAGAGVKALLERSGVAPAEVRVVTSSLRRAMQTGEAVASALGVTAVVDADWDEQAFGDWDGLTWGELSVSQPEALAAVSRREDAAPAGGETHAQLASRVAEALARAVEPGGTVVVATHRKPIMCVLERLLGLTYPASWSLAQAPAAITAVELWPDGGHEVSFVNDTHHLHDLGELSGS